MTTWDASQSMESDRCPYLKAPFEGCRVQVITSKTIPNILEYCGEHYRECPLYREKCGLNSSPRSNR
jgi:hypothetical protein